MDIANMDNLILRTIARIASKSGRKSYSEAAVKSKGLHCG
jgi:hypothetical protein